MATDAFAAASDALLDRLLLAAPGARDAEIERLVTGHARPLIERILSHRTRAGSALTRDDADDIAGAVVVRLVERLRRLSASDPIESFENYTATLTHNAINDHFRRAFPARASLRNRFRNDPRLAIWPTTHGLACGLSAWEGTLPGALPAHIALDDLHAFFASAGHAVAFDALVEHAAARDAAAHEPPVIPAVADDLERRQLLQTLWREIGELKPMQRKALLLNLRGGESMNVMALLVLTGTAKLAEIAAALEMSMDELRAIWDELPIEDLRIAAMLGVTRQQVIDLRRAARTRLAKKVKR
jgi:RNA polymerase sigma factor (sigma-70 family)